MKVLITGITGFVGSHIAKGFLDLNWDVVGTVCSADKGDALKNQPAFSAFQAEKLSFVVVEHLENYDFSSELKDVDAIAHAASPCHMDGKEIEEYNKHPYIHTFFFACHQNSCVSEMNSKSSTEAQFSHLTLAIPAIEGTSNLLMAARSSPTVKAVAMTSSFGAMLDLRKTALEQSDKTYTERDWFSVSSKSSI